LARVIAMEDVQAEAEFVAQQIHALIERGLLEHPGHAAVLYRTNAQSDVLVAALRGAGVPYRMHAHADLFRERVVRDLLAYLRLARDPSDQPSLARIVDRPRRGLGGLSATLLAEPTTVPELTALAAQFEPQVALAAATFVAMIYQLHASAGRGVPPTRLLDEILDRSGYRDWLERRPDHATHLQTVSRLGALVQRTDVSLAEWLDALALGEEVDITGQEESVRLCTIHQSKGREWRTAFLTGVEEGLIPHQHSLQDDDAVQGELRLLYVAMTRVRERLFASYCRDRTKAGRLERRQPSRWLYALPPEFVAVSA
jgi:DNA helicase-2/ATP-dependent DNA helicase PcrA